MWKPGGGAGGAPSRYKFWSRTSATESNGLWWNSPPLKSKASTTRTPTLGLVKLWYQRDDETEVLIRLLGFGPVVRVLGPARFVRQLRERIDKQMAYLSAGEPQCKD